MNIPSVTTYGIFDAAHEPKILELFDVIDAPYSCLFPEPVDDEMKSSAPYLVKITSEVREWLGNNLILTGVYFTTQYENFKILRRHCRSYLSITIPEVETPILCRYYDPRVVWSFVNMLSQEQKTHFFYPMLTMYTRYNEPKMGYTPNSIKISEPSSVVDESLFTNQSVLNLTKSQYESMQMAYIRHKAYTLLPIMQHWYEHYFPDKYNHHPIFTYSVQKGGEATQNTGIASPPKIHKEQWIDFATELLSMLSELGIAQERNIQGIVQLCMNRAITTLDEFPTSWRYALSDIKSTENYRVHTLLRAELGYVPTLFKKELTHV